MKSAVCSSMACKSVWRREGGGGDGIKWVEIRGFGSCDIAIGLQIKAV
jgi:hypothetical protein